MGEKQFRFENHQCPTLKRYKFNKIWNRLRLQQTLITGRNPLQENEIHSLQRQRAAKN